MFHREDIQRSSVSGIVTEFSGRYHKTYETIITLGAMEYQQRVSVQYAKETAVYQLRSVG